MEHQLIEVGQNKRTIGHLLLEAGKLQPQDADQIIKAQKEYGLRFGDAAVKLGLVTKEDIVQIVSKQFDYSCLTVGDDSIDSRVITAFHAYGDDVEALRGLRSQLSLRWFAENKSLVFNKFFREENDITRKTKGTGLGMYIVKYLVTTHKGTIQLKDNQPQGLIVEIEIPN